jgi:hypothetical protein
MRVLLASHIRPAALIVLRHPDEVVASLGRRDFCPAPVSAALWLHHMLTVEYATRGCPRAVLPYDALLRDWRGSLSRASYQAGVSWPVAWDLVAAAMRQYLDDGLRHHRQPVQAMLPIGAPQRWLNGVYQALLALADADGDPRLLSRLDALRADFGHWCRQHGRPLTAASLDGHPMREQRIATIPAEWEPLASQLAQNVAAYPHGV